MRASHERVVTATSKVWAGQIKSVDLRVTRHGEGYAAGLRECEWAKGGRLGECEGRRARW
jgi:hypothetical protein